MEKLIDKYVIPASGVPEAMDSRLRGNDELLIRSIIFLKTKYQE
jgi:hypothetical protein